MRCAVAGSPSSKARRSPPYSTRQQYDESSEVDRAEKQDDGSQSAVHVAGEKTCADDNGIDSHPSRVEQGIDNRRTVILSQKRHEAQPSVPLPHDQSFADWSRASILFCADAVCAMSNMEIPAGGKMRLWGNRALVCTSAVLRLATSPMPLRALFVDAQRFRHLLASGSAFATR